MRRLWPLVFVAACDPLTGSTDGGWPIPALDSCEKVQDWEPEAARFEELVVEALDDAREAGADCGDRGRIGPAPPLRRNGRLRCAARVHSRDMARNDFFGHEDPDGKLAWERIADTGYPFANASEQIAAGELSALGVVEDVWLPREGACAAISAPEFTEVGVGYRERADTKYGAYLTVVLAQPL